MMQRTLLSSLYLLLAVAEDGAQSNAAKDLSPLPAVELSQHNQLPGDAAGKQPGTGSNRGRRSRRLPFVNLPEVPAIRGGGEPGYADAVKTPSELANFPSCCGASRKLYGIGDNLHRIGEGEHIVGWQDQEEDESPFHEPWLLAGASPPPFANGPSPSPMASPSPFQRPRKKRNANAVLDDPAPSPFPKVGRLKCNCTKQDTTSWEGGDVADVDMCQQRRSKCAPKLVQSSVAKEAMGIVSLATAEVNKFGGVTRTRDIKCDPEDNLLERKLPIPSPVLKRTHTNGPGVESSGPPGCNAHKPSSTLNDCKVTSVQIIQDQKIDYSLDRDALAASEVVDMFKKLDQIDWTTPLHHHMACIDGRTHEEIIGTAGGDLGEFIVSLDVVASYLDAQPHQETVTTLLREYIRGSSCDRKFYHFNSEAAHNALMTNVTSVFSTLPMGFSISDPKSTALKDAILDRVTDPTFVGSDHIKNLLEAPQRYGIKAGIVEKVLVAFHQVMWDKDDLTHKQITYQLVKGEHVEKGLVTIDVQDDFCKSKGVVPLMPTITCNNFHQILMHQPSAARHLRADMAAYMVNSLDVDGSLASELDELVEQMHDLATRVLVRTASGILKGYPVYTVKLDEDELNEQAEPSPFVS